MKTGVLLFAALPFAAQAATFSANLVADAFVTTGSANSLSDSNYGGAGALSIAAPGSGKGEFQSVMRYDLSAALTFFNTTFGAGNWTVQSVSLQLTAQSANNAIFNTPAAGLFGVSWMENDSWAEGTGSPSSPSNVGITYNSLLNSFINTSADQALGAFSYSGATSGSFTYSLGFSSGLLSDVQSGDVVSLRLFSADSTMSGVFPSRTFGTPASRPLLTIDALAVPEPSPLALASLTIVCCFAWRLSRQMK
jgi:hypothetical protein